MGLLTLQASFGASSPEYERPHALPSHVRKAARALMQCRTVALGGPVQSWPDGHVTRVWDNSWRHRSCPQGAFMQVERWLASQRARLLACDHSHVSVPLPPALHPWWLGTVPVMPSLVCTAVREPLTTLLAAPKSLGAQPGIIATRHTWGQPLGLHPHLHWLVTGGGRTPSGQWAAVRNGFRRPVRVGMAVFRGKFLAARRPAGHWGALPLPEALRPQPLLTLLHRLGHPQQTRWHVHSMPR